MQSINVFVKFKRTTECGEYCDALCFSKERYDAIKQSEIDSMIDERVNRWVDLMKNPPPQTEPTAEEIQQNIDIKTQEIAELQAKKDSIILRVLNK
jgi:hypothetical protein